MFYAHFVLAKKGPLARIWLAAHWDKKLTKAHVFETSIEKSVEGILHPKVKMALRTSGHLLLGVVRIYSRKAKYLLADCNEAFVKIKMAFRPGMVDLPEESREAAVQAITLPEVFHDFDAGLAEIGDVDITAQLSLNQSRAEEITLREDYGGFGSLEHADDGFGDFTPEFGREAIAPQLDEERRAFDIGAEKSGSGFGDIDGSGFVGSPLHNTGGGLFEDPQFDAVGSPQLPNSPLHDDGGPGDSDFDTSLPNSPAPSPLKVEQPRDLFAEKQAIVEEESFALAPVEMPLKGLVGGAAGPSRATSKRKRKLIVDEIKNISGEEMKGQLSDTSDIVTTLDLAPPTKRLMHWKETGGVEKLFALPGRHIPSRVVGRSYQIHLTSRPMDDEDVAGGRSGDLQPPQLGPPEGATSPRRTSSRRRGGEKRKEPPVLEEELRQTASNNFEPENSTSVPNFSTPQFPSNYENQPPPQLDSSSFFHNAPPLNDTTLMENMGYDGTGAPGELRDLAMEKMLGSVAGTPWGVGGGEDYEWTNSVGAQGFDEQLPTETLEEFEERILNRRAAQMHQLIRSRITEEPTEQLDFSGFCPGRSTRKQVAQKFYTLLVLKKARAIELVQSGSYEEIWIKKGIDFETTAGL